MICLIHPCALQRDHLGGVLHIGSYDLLARNCNHFSDALCQRLCAKRIPGWVNRAARVGQSVRPMLNAAAGAAQKPDGKGGAPQDDSGMSEKETDLKDMVDHSKVCVWMRPHLRAC